ncbi:HIT family protein [Schleiferia thermophila]|mgnify:CR=1 FL=1|jgi:histidine triad (HIT) family protein|uniref:Histidine triad (HIT) family protein n=1 Tax=Schleiferia thermophila TaxID=884107 RepID=A0A369A3M8_9FLAO|nr:HIT family protein [Schleiferia thermophila]KFD38732.1 HIT family hydrolase [Schleiferia thermophila str. Yellowstone]RCX02054.1 histidine triad (HIT) family protein [Schleiferia thermophila]GCD80578.1 HIT family protein [Schleiferia thermophila]
MASIFTKIVKGEVPAYIVAETENCIAFLDIFPLVEGHTLVIPKIEVDDLFDLPDEIYSELWTLAKKVAFAIKSAYPCIKVGVAVVGLEVPHAHIHLMPINQIDDLNFSKPKLKLSPEVFENSRLKISAFMS